MDGSQPCGVMPVRACAGAGLGAWLGAAWSAVCDAVRIAMRGEHRSPRPVAGAGGLSRPGRRAAALPIAAVAVSLAAALAAPSACAAPAEIKLQADWQVGQVLRYRFENLRKSPDSAPRSTAFDLRLEVLERSAQGSLLKGEWSVPDGAGPIESGDRWVSDATWLRDLPKTPVGVALVFRTDADGMVEDLENWREVADRMVSMLESAKAQATRPMRHKVLDGVLELYASQQGAGQHALSEIDLLFSAFGSVLVPGRPLQESSILDMAPLGRLKTKEHLLLRLDKPVKGQLTHEYRREVGGRELLKLVEKFMSPPLDPALRRQSARLVMNDHTVHVLSGATGAVLSLEHTRTVGLPDGQSPQWTDFLRVTRLPND